MALIKGKQLVAGTIDTRELKDSAVTNAKISAGVITPDRLNISGQAFDFSSAASLSAPTPSAAGHVATKAYADSIAQGLDVKESVKMASTGALSAFNWSSGTFQQIGQSSTPPQIDGVSLALGLRVLVKDQSTAAENGVYVVTVAGDAFTKWEMERADDFNSSDNVTNGAFVFVGSGSTQAGAGFVLTSDDPITINTTALNFTQFSGAGQLIDGDGIALSGNTISLDLLAAGGLEIDTAQLSIKAEDASLVLSANGVKVQHNGNSTATDTNGIKAAVPSNSQLDLTPNISALDYSNTGISLSAAPADGSRIDVFVNGVMATLGDGVKNKDCYFSNDNGITARAFSAIASGDGLYWNGTTVYPLDGTDRVSLHYNAAL